MDYGIIADSSCDLTPELKKQLGVVIVPLVLTLGEENFVDNEKLDVSDYMEKMKKFNGKTVSACPPPALYKEAFVGKHSSFAVTLSSMLSGSHTSAMLGKALAEEEGADVHVFDSKSASAGELLIAWKIRKMIDKGVHKLKIITTIENFINEMKTYFVIENVDNLAKNGRLNKIAGKIISALNIKPIMGSDGDGNITLFSYARGQNQIIRKLSDTIEQSGKTTDGDIMVITHCNNHGLAEKLMNAIKNRYRFQEILVVPTRGLSSMYVNDKGVIMAF